MSHKSAHCLILPYPVQGHINPMLQFSKRLQAKGVKITIAATKSLLKTMQQSSNSVSVEAISDGYDDGGIEEAENFENYITRFEQVGFATLSQLIQNLMDRECPVNCIVYDPFLPWAVEVAKEFGLSCAAFFTQSCTVDSIYYHAYKGVVKLPPTEAQVVVPGFSRIETLSKLQVSDVPSFGSTPESERVLAMLVNQFSNLDGANWVLINSFYELEKEVIDWMSRLYQIKTIGPTIPSMYLDKRLQDDKEYGLSVFKPMTSASLNWLNNQTINSVVYVSFGSLAKLEAKQMEEVAWGVKNSSKNFLWVVRSTEEDKLPNNFVEELKSDEKGLVVSWCPQLEVLAHKSIGCFLTHCGWNSTLEAISLGVPMVVMPQWSDQPTNAKLVEDFWEIGVKAKPNDKGIVTREVIEECIKLVMEEEKGEKIRGNANKWKELARKSADEEGSSDRNIEEFVSKLVSV